MGAVGVLSADFFAHLGIVQGHLCVLTVNDVCTIYPLDVGCVLIDVEVLDVWFFSWLLLYLDSN